MAHANSHNANSLSSSHQLPPLPPGPGGVYTSSHIFDTSPARIPYGNRRELPLDLVQRIIAFIDDVGDLARTTRTSRLFHYMAIPRLYESVTLKSYPELRYIEGQLEGYGGGSPFSMALNGLVTRNVAAFVKRWKVTGEWRETDVEQFSLGRVPDNSMMLNIALRAALDRMSMLSSFCWDMNAKPTPTIYEGLSAKPTLEYLTIKCPTSRVIRPVCLVPPVPNLKSLSLRDIDPLCYPDDFSLLLLQSKKLAELNLHFSPRMREQCEPSINLHMLFGRCLKARQKLRIKNLGIQNMYVMNRGEFSEAIDVDTLERISFINNIDHGNPNTVFFDTTWILDADSRGDVLPRHLKSMRGESVDLGHAHLIAQNHGLEEFYIIGRRSADVRAKSKSRGSSVTVSPIETGLTPSAASAPSPAGSLSLASTYLAALTKSHGKTLRIVLLSEQWQLGVETMKQFFSACPNLEQFGVGLEDNDVGVIRKTISFAPKLWALRVLTTPSIEEESEFEGPEMRDLIVSLDMAADACQNIRWFSLGPYVYYLQPGNILVEENPKHLRHLNNVPKIRRLARKAEWKDAEHVEIFGLDKMEL